MAELSRVLEWDSNFFGKQIAQINAVNAEDSAIFKEIDSLFDKGTECIYLSTDRPIDLSGYDSLTADKKRTYIHETPEYQQVALPDKIGIESPCYTGHPSDLYDLALQSGEYSRFRVDPHFSKEDFENLYKKWVDNSMYEGFADYVIAATSPSPIGLMTAKREHDRIKIGLIATDTKYRGKGIGKQLMRTILNKAAESNLKVEVVTQADNIPACRFYEALGFRVLDETLIYHIWNDRDSKKIKQ